MNVIVTGASKGIGYEVVKAFAAIEGNKVIAVSRNRLLLEKLAAECLPLKSGKDVFFLPCDLTSNDQINKIPRQIDELIPGVDVLINNAGVLLNRPFENLTEMDFDMIFNSNVKSIFRLVQLLLPRFERGSHIVNIGSMGGFQGSSKFPGLSLYSASKGAVGVLTECLAVELKDRDIRVNCLALGSAQTEMFEAAFPGKTAATTAEEIAKFIVNFAVGSGKFINGKIIPVSSATP